MPLFKVGYIRVTHPCAGRPQIVQAQSLLPLDLHVLSLPLAFILSQDQTLHCKRKFKYHSSISKVLLWNTLRRECQNLAAQYLQRTLFYLLKRTSKVCRFISLCPPLSPCCRFQKRPSKHSERDCKGMNSFLIHQIFRELFSKKLSVKNSATVFASRLRVQR